MTVRLRGHHLLCMLTYAGKGYNAAFTANYDRIATRLSRGEDILIVDGPDDICAPLLGDAEPHCLGESVVERDLQAMRDIGRLLAWNIQAGVRLEPGAELLARLRAGFSGNETRAACAGCEWADLCSAISADGFQEVRVVPDQAS